MIFILYNIIIKKYNNNNMDTVIKKLSIERIVMQGVSRTIEFSEFYLMGELIAKTPGDYLRPTIKLNGKVYNIKEDIKN